MRFRGTVSGWMVFETDTEGLYVFARLAPDERGEFVVRDVLVSSAMRVTAADLRAVPLNQLEAQANDPRIVLELLLERDGTADVGLGLAEADGFIDGLRARTEQVMPAFTDELVVQDVIALPRPDGSNPDGFYREVARAYRTVSGVTNRPAAAIATASGVPVPTARRWIAEARRRGHLPPGQKGRAG